MANDHISVAKLDESSLIPRYLDISEQPPAHETIQVFTREAIMQVEAERKAKGEAAAQRQRDEDAALADADEIVRRMRVRLGRRVCTVADGRTIREIWERLKALSGPETTADNDEIFR